MKQFLYNKTFLVIASCLVAVGLLAGSTYAIQHQNKVVRSSEKATGAAAVIETPQPKTPPAKSQASHNEPVTGTDVPTAKSTAPLQTPVSAKPPASSQPAYTAPSVPQQPAAPVQVATCNETMKTSYTNLYNSKVAAENLRWSNQQSSIRNEANSRGMAFSGVPQEEIDAAKPTHDANLASIENEYQSNLASINCL